MSTSGASTGAGGAPLRHGGGSQPLRRLPDLHHRLQAPQRHPARGAVAAGPRRRAGRVPERGAGLPRHRLPALRGPALRPGVSDRGHAPARRRARHHGLRHLHRLRLLRGGVPLPGPHHRPRARVVLRDAEPAGGAGLPRRTGRGGDQVHLLRGQDRRGGADPGRGAGARPGGHPRLRRVVHRQALHFGDFADPDSNVSRLAARERSLPDARGARDRSADPLPLRGARDHPGAGARGGGRRRAYGAIRTTRWSASARRSGTCARP